MSSRWRRPASTAGAVAAALRVRRPIVGLVRANYPPWPGGNLAHHPCTDNTLIISDTHENCKGFCAVFSGKFLAFFTFSTRKTRPVPAFAIFRHIHAVQCVLFWSVFAPFALVIRTFCIFVHATVLIFLLLRQVLFTLIRVYLFVMSLTCRFLTNVRTSIYIAECSSLLFPHKKHPVFRRMPA